MKIKLTNKNLQYYRLQISEPSQSMLDTLKNYWEENNIDTNVYGEWDKVSVEIEGNNILLYTPRLIYYFDDYTTIPYEFASEELNIINNYLDKNFDRYPDNYVLGLGDAEYEELVDTIDKRHNVDLAVALNIALGIVEIEEFTVEVQTVTKEDYKLFKDNITEDEVGKSAFFLVDMQGANLGGIENQTYYSMAGIIDRMDTYHEDYLYRPFEERRDADIINGRKPPNLSDGKEIEKGDWDSAILYLLSNDKFAKLLEEITPENYDALLNLSNKIKNNLPMGYKSAVSYMTDKIIAESIIETQSAYVMAEKDNKVYLSNYGYGDGYYVKTIDEGWTEIPVSAKDAFWQDIIDKEWVYDENGISDWGEQVFTVHNNYNEIIEQEKSQILEDIKDIGIDNHYLNEYAFCYLGMEEEYCSAMNEKGIDEEDLDELDICD